MLPWAHSTEQAAAVAENDTAACNCFMLQQDRHLHALSAKLSTYKRVNERQYAQQNSSHAGLTQCQGACNALCLTGANLVYQVHAEGVKSLQLLS